jgi:hypothetical protein
MRDLIDVQKEMCAHEDSVNEIYQKLMQGEQIVSFDALCVAAISQSASQTDAIERYNNGVEAKATEYTMLTSRQRYAKHEAYIKFRQAIHVSVLVM